MSKEIVVSEDVLTHHRANFLGAGLASLKEAVSIKTGALIYSVNKNIDNITAKLEVLNKSMVELQEVHIELDEDGKPKIGKPKKGETEGSIIYKSDESKAIFEDEMQKIWNSEIDVKIHMMSYEDFSKLEFLEGKKIENEGYVIKWFVADPI